MAGDVRDGVVGDELPEFSGKVVLFYVTTLARGMANGVVVEQAEFRRFGQKLYENRMANAAAGLAKRCAR